MATPSPDDLHIAAQWLDIYEGAEDAEDAEACKRVAKWLIEQSKAAELRQICRDAGVSVAHAKRVMKQKGL
jgi:hypothetical protein